MGVKIAAVPGGLIFKHFIKGISFIHNLTILLGKIAKGVIDNCMAYAHANNKSNIFIAVLLCKNSKGETNSHGVIDFSLVSSIRVGNLSPCLQLSFPSLCIGCCAPRNYS